MVCSLLKASPLTSADYVELALEVRNDKAAKTMWVTNRKRKGRKMQKRSKAEYFGGDDSYGGGLDWVEGRGAFS